MAECFSSVKGLVMRATRVSSCGVPVTGAPNDSAVSDGFVRVELSPETETGTEYKVKKADGTYCINDRGPTLFSWLNYTAEFCRVDPELYELISAMRILDDWNGESVGFALDEDAPGRVHVALEVWTALGGDPCAAGSERWIYWLFPHIVDSVLGDLTIEDAAASFTLTGRTKSGSLWGRGPYNVVAINGAGTPGILQAPGVTSKDHLLMRLTEIAPPTAACGYTP